MVIINSRSYLYLWTISFWTISTRIILTIGLSHNHFSSGNNVPVRHKCFFSFIISWEDDVENIVTDALIFLFNNTRRCYKNILRIKVSYRREILSCNCGRLKKAIPCDLVIFDTSKLRPDKNYHGCSLHTTWIMHCFELPDHEKGDYY